MIKVITLAQIFFIDIAPYNYSLSYAVETGYIRFAGFNMMFWLSIQVIGLYFIHINCQSSIYCAQRSFNYGFIFVVPYKGQAAEVFLTLTGKVKNGYSYGFSIS